MKTVETENQGLKRAYTLTIPAKDIDARVDEEVQAHRAASAHARLPPRQGSAEPHPQDARRGAAARRAQQRGPGQASSSCCTEKKLRPAMQPRGRARRGL